MFVRKDEVNTYENNRRVKSVSEKTKQKYYEAIYNFVEAKNNDGKCPYNIYTQDNWIVYDPFMGSGTTAVSCKKRNLNYIGSEISSQQVEYANQRITQLNYEIC